MKKFLLSTFALAVATFTMAQVRYLEPVFDEIEIESDVTYGNNISILTGSPVPIDLKCQIYSPANDITTGDTDPLRPVIVVAHTGSFLPPIYNGTTSGDLGDSTVVEVCNRLARMGYVVASMTYRQGWRPDATDQNVRTGTLLQAVYRAVQDARTCIRYLRKTAIDEGNPYKINPEKIGMWGIGSGGYISFAAGTLDDYEEVLIDKFLNSEDLTPLADTALLGNFYATSNAPLCIANHVGYSSDFDVAVNMGGAMGDISWIDGKENEPTFVGFHCIRDPFAPWYAGTVIVPTTGQNVVAVSGTRRVVEMANSLGNNDLLSAIPASIDPIKPIVDFQKTIEVDYAGQTLDLGTDNAYTFVTNSLEGSPWDWWDLNVIRAQVDFINNNLEGNFDADEIHQNGLLTNPDMSAEKARKYIDTVFQYAAPRIYYSLDLATNLDEISATEIGLELGPVPSVNEVFFEAAERISKYIVFDTNGRLVNSDEVNEKNFVLDIKDYSYGTYIIRLETENGYVTQRFIKQ